jgi:membrane protein CcdC involved in cytochrome C biogenesis
MNNKINLNDEFRIVIAILTFIFPFFIEGDVNLVDKLVLGLFISSISVFIASYLLGDLPSFLKKTLNFIDNILEIKQD